MLAMDGQVQGGCDSHAISGPPLPPAPVRDQSLLSQFHKSVYLVGCTGTPRDVIRFNVV